MTFIQKLKGEGVVQDGNVTVPQDKKEESVQINVDVQKSEHAIVIYAMIPGVEFEALNVTIEGENDVITISGNQKRPVELSRSSDGEGVAPQAVEDEYITEECRWGSFFRQMTLPEMVDPSHAKAKLKAGVLVLHLPILHLSRGGVRLQVMNVDGHS